MSSVYQCEAGAIDRYLEEERERCAHYGHVAGHVARRGSTRDPNGHTRLADFRSRPSCDDTPSPHPRAAIMRSGSSTEERDGRSVRHAHKHTKHTRNTHTQTRRPKTIPTSSTRTSSRNRSTPPGSYVPPPPAAPIHHPNRSVPPELYALRRRPWGVVHEVPFHLAYCSARSCSFW